MSRGASSLQEGCRACAGRRIAPALALVTIAWLGTARAQDPFDARLEAIRSSYGEARDATDAARVLPWPPSPDAPSVDDELAEMWPAVERWACAYVERRPATSGEALAAWVESLDPEPDCGATYSACNEELHLTATAVRLETIHAAPTWVLAMNTPIAGTLSIVGARRRGAGCEPLWRARTVGYLGGRVGMAVAPLPATGAGHARFWVDGWPAGTHGCEHARHVAVWEWTGADALAELVTEVAVGCDSAVPRGYDQATGVLLAPTKELPRTFFTAGTDPEPEGERRLRITADGVEDLGTRWRVPELERVRLETRARPGPRSYAAGCPPPCAPRVSPSSSARARS